MTVCILGNSLTALTLAKALVNYKIDVDVLFNKKNYKISSTRTIGISKNNIDYFNNNIINIEKIIWKLKRIEIFSENGTNTKYLPGIVTSALNLGPLEEIGSFVT